MPEEAVWDEVESDRFEGVSEVGIVCDDGWLNHRLNHDGLGVSGLNGGNSHGRHGPEHLAASKDGRSSVNWWWDNVAVVDRHDMLDVSSVLF